MQDKHLFEYAVIRVVPRVEREEFLNVGVILYCAEQRFLQTLFSIDVSRLGSVYTGLDFTELEERLRSFERICSGVKEGGPIAKLPIASRFRWLTATRSTILQTSKVHPGFCSNAKETLLRLHSQLVT